MKGWEEAEFSHEEMRVQMIKKKMTLRNTLQSKQEIGVGKADIWDC